MKHTDITNRERNRYFYGKLLTVRDFELEQDYHIAKRCLINRAVFGSGVVCGLGVTVSDDTTLLIESGLAIDHAGREILLPEPLIRKLPMLPGYEDISGKPSAYLCLEYDEEPIEPVNAVGAETGSRQHNKIEERPKLYLSADVPDYRRLLASTGCANVNVLYQDQGLVIAMWLPEAVCAGEEFAAGVLVIRDRETPPVHFTIAGDTDYLDAEADALSISFEQSPEDDRLISNAELKLKAKGVSGVVSGMFRGKATLRVEYGDHVYSGEVTPDVSMRICADDDERAEYIRIHDSFQRRCSTGELPIYLAKLELIGSMGGSFVCGASNLPFGQSAKKEGAPGPSAAASDIAVSASTGTLEYWQPPEVRASYSALSKKLHFDFALPAPQAYDFATAHGTEVITLPSGMRVNSRCISGEITHGLGAGNVDVRTAVEFTGEDGEVAELFGSSEVFKSKQTKKLIPWVETAVITYPERGTMRIGLWLHDNVDGSAIKVHWFVSRPQNDSGRIREKAELSVTVSPEVLRLSVREKAHFKARVMGSEDRGVIFSVKDDGGGAIDENGIYQAPETKGTYEITAAASADPSVKASAFVIVE